MTYNAEINPLTASGAAPVEVAELPAVDDSTSAYKKRLNRWAIARIIADQKLVDQKLEVVARFRSRSDADGHLGNFRQRFPGDRFLVIVDKKEQ